MSTTRPRLPFPALAPALALVALASACSSTRSSTSAGPDTSEWLRPSAALQQQIDQHAAKVPWTNLFQEQVELIQWFTAVGEPAYPTLLEMARDERPLVAGTAFAALGATRDPRLVEHVRALPAPADEVADLRYERARCLLLLGDWSEIPVLIEGLRDERPYARALCSKALVETTRETIEFDPKGEAQQREQAVARWEAWWQARSADQLLAR